MSGRIPQPPQAPAVTFQVGSHQVAVEGVAGAWRVTVDGRALPDGYRTRADAWEAGVREADRLGGPPPG